METPQKPFEKKRVLTSYGVVALLILLALLLTLQPTGGTVFAAAKKAMVADRFNQIQTAELSYYTEYSVYPVAPDAATLVRILTGATKDGNQRQIAFANFKPSDLGAKGDLLDPWGTPNTPSPPTANSTPAPRAPTKSSAPPMTSAVTRTSVFRDLRPSSVLREKPGPSPGGRRLPRKPRLPNRYVSRIMSVPFFP